MDRRDRMKQKNNHSLFFGSLSYVSRIYVLT